MDTDKVIELGKVIEPDKVIELGKVSEETKGMHGQFETLAEPTQGLNG